VDGADEGHRSAQFAGQPEGVDVAAAGLHEVAHVEQNQGGYAEGQHRGGQHQLAGEVKESRTSRTASGLGVPGILPLSTSMETRASRSRD